jgi:hypothetical protein
MAGAFCMPGEQMNESYRAALLAERAALEPFAEGHPHKARRLALIDEQLAPSAAELRAAHHEAAGDAAESSVGSVPPAAENTADKAPKETAVSRRGKSKEN